MTPPANLQPFALVRELGEAESVVGYGLVLPDGSAISISWPPTGGSSCYQSASAERIAILCAADLVFLDRRA
jgi:hypothetical protein